MQHLLYAISGVSQEYTEHLRIWIIRCCHWIHFYNDFLQCLKKKMKKINQNRQ